MLREELRYAYAVARVRSLETKLLDRAKVERLLDAGDAQELLRALQETEYAPHVAQINSPFEYEEILSGELRRVRDLVTSFAPDPDLIAVLFARYDFHNLRTALKAAVQGIEPPVTGFSRAGQVSVEALRDLVSQAMAENTGDQSFIPGVEQVSEALRRATYRAVQAFRAGGDPQVIDLVVDRAAQEYYLETAAKHNAQFLAGYLARLADLTNLRSCLRVRRMGRDQRFLRSVLLPGGTVPGEVFIMALEGPVESVVSALSRTIYAQVAQEGLRLAEETGRLTKLEALTWDFLMTYLRGARHIHFGFPAVWAYVMAKEAETRLLRFIFVGKLNGLSRDKIAERLFDTYV